jgi:putative transcriptional regulator
VPDLSPVAQPNVAALRVHLARLRHERRWSYDELSARSGVARATIVAHEYAKPDKRRDQRRPATSGTLITWWRLAQALGVDLGELLQPLYSDEPRGVDPGD